MRWPWRRRPHPPHVLAGPVRVDRRTKDLVKRAAPGDVAVIDHLDLDRIAAEGLVEAQVAAVVNAASSISGRYPNGGPQVLIEAGIPLVDEAGAGVFDALAEGATVRIDGGEIWLDDRLVAKGEVLTADAVEAAMADARASIGAELRRFAANTLEYIEHEAPLLFEPVTLPPLHTRFKGRHALIVVRGHDYRHDLRSLRSYIREFRPVTVAVDGGADALLEFGITPDVIIGDFDSLSDRALHCGAELVHHVHVDGRAPGREALEASGLPYHEFVLDGMSEDVAMTMAYEAGARLIVAVGTHATMVEMLDKGRKGMSSTFLTRLRLGPVLVDAKGVNQLYRGQVRHLDIVLLVASAFVAVVTIAIVSEPIHVFLDGLQLSLRDLWPF